MGSSTHQSSIKVSLGGQTAGVERGESESRSSVDLTGVGVSDAQTVFGRGRFDGDNAQTVVELP